MSRAPRWRSPLRRGSRRERSVSSRSRPCLGAPPRARRWAPRTRSQLAQERAALIRSLSHPGCPFCQVTAEAEERFFVWYLAETYQFPESIERICAAGGFCPRHTQRFIRDGIPSTIAYAYRHLVRSTLNRIEEAERTLRAGRVREAASLLLPSGTCPACAQEKSSAEHLRGRLAHALADKWGRPSHSLDSALCLPHLRMLVPLLLPDALSLLVRGFRAKLLSATTREVFVWMWGENRDHEQDASLQPVEPSVTRTEQGWSPTIHRLRDLLEASVCPVCRAEESVRAQHLTWLSREILMAPSYGWEEASSLCPRPGWAFAQGGDPEAVRALAERMREVWAERLGKLFQKLAPDPSSPAQPLLKAIPRALGHALFSRRRAVRETEAALRVRPCPACKAERTVTKRTATLLLSSLGDPSVRASYERGQGLCPDHLALALALAEGQEEALGLARIARVRLQVLAWELEEYLRKQSWSVRYEEPGPEETAWIRAVEFLSRANPER